LTQKLAHFDVALGHHAGEGRADHAVTHVLCGERGSGRRRLHVERQRATLRDLLLVLEVADSALGFELLVALALGARLLLLRANALHLGARVGRRERGRARVEAG
jgi:hypothetical protein